MLAKQVGQIIFIRAGSTVNTQMFVKRVGVFIEDDIKSVRIKLTLST